MAAPELSMQLSSVYFLGQLEVRLNAALKEADLELYHRSSIMVYPILPLTV